MGFEIICHLTDLGIFLSIVLKCIVIQYCSIICMTFLQQLDLCSHLVQSEALKRICLKSLGYQLKSWQHANWP